MIQIDDSVIIHPLAMHMVQQYAKEGYQVAVNEFQFARAIWESWTGSTTLS